MNHPIIATMILALANWYSCEAVHAKETDKSCRICHEAAGTPHLSLPSPHGDFECKECHRHPLSARFHKGVKDIENFTKPLTSIAIDEIRLSEEQVFAVHKQCQSCHQTQFKDWSRNRHAFTYGDSFLNAAHNKLEQPINDCLRCHAMFFNGAIGDIVTPLNNKGPWKLKTSGMAKRLSIPCLSCHRVHPPEQAPAVLARYASSRSAPKRTNSLHIGFYDRREKSFFTLDDLPHPRPNNGKETVLISADERIRNCYQCHAPNATHRVKTSDDKTPSGVHESLSCLDCHDAHSLSAINSCSKCHPRSSHCKIDVAQMDTSAKNSASKHDIHTVACADCHAKDSKSGR